MAITVWLSYFYLLFLTGSPATLHVSHLSCRTFQNHLIYWVHSPSPNGYAILLFCCASSAFIRWCLLPLNPFECAIITIHTIFHHSWPEQRCASVMKFWSPSALPTKYFCATNASVLLMQQDQPAFSAQLGRIPLPHLCVILLYLGPKNSLSYTPSFLKQFFPPDLHLSLPRQGSFTQNLWTIIFPPLRIQVGRISRGTDDVLHSQFSSSRVWCWERTTCISPIPLGRVLCQKLLSTKGSPCPSFHSCSAIPSQI